MSADRVTSLSGLSSKYEEAEEESIKIRSLSGDVDKVDMLISISSKISATVYVNNGSENNRKVLL